jgi:hypothetical protein
MKYSIGIIVYVNKEFDRHRFSARTGEIIYKNSRQRLYTVQFRRGRRIEYLSEQEITPVAQTYWRPSSSAGPKSSTYRPKASTFAPKSSAPRPFGRPGRHLVLSRGTKLILGFVGLTFALSVAHGLTPSSQRAPGPIYNANPVAPTIPAPGQAAPVAQEAGVVRPPSGQPNVRIEKNTPTASANSFTATGRLVNDGSVATVNNTVTVILFNRQGQEIARKQSNLGTLPIRGSKEFSVSFTGDPSGVGSYQIYRQAQYWR